MDTTPKPLTRLVLNAETLRVLQDETTEHVFAALKPAPRTPGSCNLGCTL